MTGEVSENRGQLTFNEIKDRKEKKRERRREERKKKWKEQEKKGRKVGMVER